MKVLVLSSPSDFMRLDVFLKASRLIPRRSLAQRFCDDGLVLVNGTVAKSSKEVKEGDHVRINRRSRVVEARIAAIPSTKQVSKSEAAGMLEMILDEAVPSTI